jgi:hypothetical protein
VNLTFVFLGAIATLAGLALLVAGIRGRPGKSPQATAKLIGGMMLAAFGILIAGFAIGYARAAPMEVAR